MSEPTIVVAVIGLISGVVVAVIAYLQHNGSKIAEKNSNDFRELISAQREEIKTAKVERDQAILEMDKARNERDVALLEIASKERIIADKEGQIADRDELISDYRLYNRDVDIWGEGGYKPPNPTKPWRVKWDESNWNKS